MPPPKKKRPPIDLLRLLRAAADVLPRAPAGPGFRPVPPVLRAADELFVREPPARRPNLAARVGSALTDIAQVLPSAIRAGAVEVARGVESARTPGDLIRALSGFEVDPTKPSTPVGQALAAVQFIPVGGVGVRGVQTAARGARAAARAVAPEAARLTPSQMVNFLHGIAPDPLDIPAFVRAGGRVRTIGSTLGAGDIARLPARERIVGAAVRGADGKVYTGVTHSDARDAAVEALRATPEGQIAIATNGGNAIIRNSEGFATTTGNLVSREDASRIARVRGQAPGLSPEFMQLHSSDLFPREK